MLQKVPWQAFVEVMEAFAKGMQQFIEVLSRKISWKLTWKLQTEDMVKVEVTVTAKHRVRLLQWKLPWRLSRIPPLKLFLWTLLPWKHARKFP